MIPHHELLNPSTTHGMPIPKALTGTACRTAAARTLMRRLALPLALAAALPFLGGCVPLLLGGAFVGGSMVAVDRRSSGTQVDDESIELKSIARIHEAIGDRGHISVTSYNRLALITGEVPAEADKAKVEQAVGGIANVRAVVNELAIMAPSSLGTRSNDSLLTSKVKASLIDAKDIQSNSFKVVTDRGIVYLMGVVSEREAKRASDVTRGISGVVKVVRVFDIVSENALAGMEPPRPAASKP